MLLGTIVNVIAVLVGSGLGLLIHTRLPQRISGIVFQAIGVFILFLGVRMAMNGLDALPEESGGNGIIILIFSMVIGSIWGEWINLDSYLNRWGDRLKTQINIGHEHFTEGLVTAFLLFCMGSMTILGAIEEGLGNPPTLLLAKSVLDGFASIALAASLGIGVMFSVIPLLIYQGGLTVFAMVFQNSAAQPIIDEMTAVGGVLLIGLGINILEIKTLRILNMLPSLLIVILLAYLFL
ncbi:MAG: DUF554 domain-containing protein [Gemmatimonadetes bacterium]|nr:MAG: DUF554 domain-containing protein [Gemmatimonadota bacterium]